VRWPDEDPEPARLPVLALLVGYDAAASRVAGTAVAVDQRPYSSADSALMDSASRLELRIASELRHAIAATDLHGLLRLAVSAPGQQRFLTTLTALTTPRDHSRPDDMSHDEIDRLRADQNQVIRASFRADILPGLTGVARAEAEATLSRIEAAAAAGPAQARANVVALLVDRLPQADQDRHADGRAFTPAESRLVESATEKEWNEARSLKDADAEIESDRLHRSVRLHQILNSAPATARLEYVADLDRQLPVPPDTDQCPLADLLYYQDRVDSAFAAAFRRHVLPDLSPQARAEASALLAHVDLGADC
jgi:hypothetical protein